MDKSPKNSGKLTGLLKAFSRGDEAAMDELMPLVYDELRLQAHRYLKKERRHHTLQTTSLVHEAYLRLIEQHSVTWQNRAHFLGISATIMRRILVNYANNRNRLKRGGRQENLAFDERMEVGKTDDDIDLLALDEALIELTGLDEQQARIVELRYFGGLTIKETAEVMKISPATVKRDWKTSRIWLRARLNGGTTA